MENDRNYKLNLHKDDPRFRIRPYQQIASSLVGATATSLLMTPLDVIKTRLQVQHKNMISSKCYLYCNGLMDHICPCNGIGTKTTLYFNGTDAFVKISRHEGVRSLWSGLSPTLVLAMPLTVIYFVAYEQFRVRLRDLYIARTSKTDVPFYIPMIAGCSSRICAVTIVNPLELVRTKMQSQKLNYKQVGRALKELVAVEGILGLWKGWLPTIYRDVPFSGIYWTSYESLKNMFNIINPTFTFSFCAGAISGCIAAFLTNPFDVIKTHRQIELGELLIANSKPKKHPSVASSLASIYSKNGLKGIFAGLVPRLARVSPACAIMIGTFEYGKSYFYRININKYCAENNISGDNLFTKHI